MKRQLQTRLPAEPPCRLSSCSEFKGSTPINEERKLCKHLTGCQTQALTAARAALRCSVILMRETEAARRLNGVGIDRCCLAYFVLIGLFPSASVS